MSARAAVRLDRLGFDVVDYAAGKADWRAAGLPIEGSEAELPTAGTLAATPATCDIDGLVEDAVERMDDDGLGLDLCVVVGNDENVVLGVYERDRGVRGDQRLVDAMKPAPLTVRASASPLPTLRRMQEKGTWYVVVTDPEGRLLGVLTGSRAAAAAVAVASWADARVGG